MKQFNGYRLVEPEDLSAAIRWAEGIRPEDPEKSEEIDRLREVLVTGLTYAGIVASNMGGLPAFDPTQSEKERQEAIKRAAKMARRPDGKGKKPW